MRYFPILLTAGLMAFMSASFAAEPGPSMDRKDEMALRASNIERAHQALTDIGSERWASLLADDVVWEYPFAQSIGSTGREVGKDNVARRLKSFVALVGGLRMYDLVSFSGEDPNTVVTEYKGEYGFNKSIVQKYIAIHQFRDGKLVLQREFWDTKIVNDVIALLKARAAAGKDNR